MLVSHPRVLCELRLDYLDLSPVAAFAFLARLPAELAPRLVLTQRLKASGPLANGHCVWDVMTWQSWWRDVLVLRPWYAVDLDWLVLDQLTGESLGWRGHFRSPHVFFSLHSTIPEAEKTLPNLLASAREHRAGVKLACPVASADELARLARMSQQLEGISFKTVVAMGAAGKAWRWSRLSGALTYFAAEASRATAPGQEEMMAVLPYLSSKHRPDLYLLLGDNPENRYGEEQWNRAFLRRGARWRYVNCPTMDPPGPEWALNIQEWLDAAAVRGVSVTKPYKLCFSPSPVNTLKRSQQWECANTDGEAVRRLLHRHGIHAGEKVTIAGGGGAARAVFEGLEENGYRPALWVRVEGKLGARPEAQALISTWPGEYQEALVAALATSGPADLHIIIDAQFSRSIAESPLARWAESSGILYIPGSQWWREQARLQDALWFGPDRLGKVRTAALALVPASKSETLRALAIAAAFGLSAEIREPALNDDTEVFVRALEALGAAVDRDGSVWRIFPPSVLRPPEEAINMSAGATGLRILGALAPLMSGTLKLTGTERLQQRPHEELFNALGAGSVAWPLVISCGGSLPSAISLERSSQFATGFLIAGAAEIHRGKRDSYRLLLEGEARSVSYLQLTLKLLQEAGIASEFTDNSITLHLAEKKNRLAFTIEKDASSLAFLEVYAKHRGLRSFFEATNPSRQGDGIFPVLLEKFLAGNPLVNLRDHPDLAPPLWAAAALFQLPIEVRDCPQLHLKESNRARLLVEATLALGGSGELRDDGFRADFSHGVPGHSDVFLTTEDDHRIAMAAGLLATENPLIGPDRRDCVRKSFPHFWHALAILEEAQPG